MTLRSISNIEGIWINPDHIEVLTIEPYWANFFRASANERFKVVALMRSGHKQYVRIFCLPDAAFAYASETAHRMGVESSATIHFTEPHPHVS